MVLSIRFGSRDTTRPGSSQSCWLIALSYSGTIPVCFGLQSSRRLPLGLSYWKAFLTATQSKLQRGSSTPNKRKRTFPLPPISTSSWVKKSQEHWVTIWNCYMTNSKPDCKGSKRCHKWRCSNPTESRARSKARDKAATRPNFRPGKYRIPPWPRRMRKETKIQATGSNPTATCHKKLGRWLKKSRKTKRSREWRLCNKATKATSFPKVGRTASPSLMTLTQMNSTSFMRISLIQWRSLEKRLGLKIWRILGTFRSRRRAKRNRPKTPNQRSKLSQVWGRRWKSCNRLSWRNSTLRSCPCVRCDRTSDCSDWNHRL